MRPRKRSALRRDGRRLRAASTLSRIADRPIEPRGLVMGSLAGKHMSPLAGFAVEFASHREYVPGDDLRHIDWRVYHTRDKYFIKQYEMETNFIRQLVLDVSKSMRCGDGDAQKLLCAARMAAALGYSVVKQSDNVSLTTFDERVVGHVPPSNSMARVVRVTEHLDGVAPAELRKGYLEALGRFNGRLAEICQRNRVERVLVDTSRPMGEVFVDCLNHRSLLNRGR